MTQAHEDTIGACGDDCSYCLRYKATLSRNTEELKRIKDLWVSFGWRDAKINWRELECRGCRKENKCADENLRNCAFEKGLKNCGMCQKYPCRLIEAAFDRTETLFKTCTFKCSREDRIALEKSFNTKKNNLDTIHKEMFG